MILSAEIRKIWDLIWLFMAPACTALISTMIGREAVQAANQILQINNSAIDDLAAKYQMMIFLNNLCETS